MTRTQALHPEGTRREEGRARDAGVHGGATSSEACLALCCRGLPATCGDPISARGCIPGRRALTGALPWALLRYRGRPAAGRSSRSAEAAHARHRRRLKRGWQQQEEVRPRACCIFSCLVSLAAPASAQAPCALTLCAVDAPSAVKLQSPRAALFTHPLPPQVTVAVCAHVTVGPPPPVPGHARLRRSAGRCVASDARPARWLGPGRAGRAGLWHPGAVQVRVGGRACH